MGASVLQQTQHLWVFPARGLSWVLVQVMPALAELHAIELKNKSEVHAALSQTASHVRWIHLGIIPSHIKLTSGCAWWGSNQPSRFGGPHEVLCLILVRLVGRVPGIAVALSCPEVEGMQPLHIEIAPKVV